MNTKKNNLFLFLLPLLTLTWVSCSKSTGSKDPYKLSYGDSIIYLKAQSGDHIVFPTEHRPGTYSGFPEGIEIDDNTGEINVSKSETGLRYRITHVSLTNDTTITLVVLSGITYFDRFYNLSLGDSIAAPVYNANENRVLPLLGSVFDSDNTANGGGCSVKTTDGKINLAETVRNGVFGSVPANNAAREFDIVYKLNDNSGKATNKIRVKLYYYDSMADVAPDLLQTLQEREDQDVFLRANNGNPFNYIGGTARTTALAKPRPPCVIIIGQ